MPRRYLFGFTGWVLVWVGWGLAKIMVSIFYGETSINILQERDPHGLGIYLGFRVEGFQSLRI